MNLVESQAETEDSRPAKSGWVLRRMPPTLEVGDVHVWAVRCSPSPARLDRYRALLSDRELARLERFLVEGAAREFTVTHGLLRVLLGHYLNLQPRALNFATNRHGKPKLAQGGIEFNMSHSRGVGLLAFAHNRRIGVDVERIDPDKVTDSLSKRAFSAWEYGQLRRMDSDLRPQAFFNCWTRKEAFIKALGKGLSFPLDSFDVSLKPGQAARLLRVQGSRERAAQWTLHDLAPFAGYSGAMVVQAGDCHLSRFLFPSEAAS